MYFHVTTVCNMSCAHCLFDYGNGKRGKHMPWETFLAGVSFAEDMDVGHVTLGGGEATRNPRLKKKMLRHIMENTDLNVFMVTNGSNAKVIKSIVLDEEFQDMGWYDERIEIRMSWDSYHDHEKVDPWCYDYFNRRRNQRGWRETTLLWGERRDKLINAGRAKNLHVPKEENECPCSSISIYPDGRITACGCKDSPVIAQTVWQGWDSLIDLATLASHEGCYSVDVTDEDIALHAGESLEDL